MKLLCYYKKNDMKFSSNLAIITIQIIFMCLRTVMVSDIISNKLPGRS